MQIYLGHSSEFDYRRLLYLPLKSSHLWQEHRFILPHDNHSEPVHSKTIISKVDLVIAEVSYPSTGLGIELGWANDANRMILCLHQQQSTPSTSLRIISDQFLQYTDPEDLITKLAGMAPV